MMFVHIIIFAITSLLVFLFICYVNIIYFMDIHSDWFASNIQDQHVYDYIIVGAGSAGSIIAAKLAEDQFNTLLVEAGGQAPPFFDIPILAPLLQGTPYDWQYVTVPQQNACKAFINNQSRWPMGKIVGGTSRLNYMAYVRGHPNDYATWFPDFTEPIAENGGPMEIKDLRWHTKIADVVLQGIKELGLQIGNINKKIDTGFMKVQLSMKNGNRWSSDSVLNKHLDTLTVVTHAFVEKILIKSKKAVGIRFKKLGKVIDVLARKGVILSAGVIGSPKLLMLSGIGPKEDLERVNIDVINDLPVGQNLVDHILTGVDLITINTSLPLSVTTMLNPVSMLEYFFYGEGPWTHSGIEVLGTFHSFAAKNDSVPDLQFMIIPTGVSKDHGVVLKKAMGISDKVYDEYFTFLASENTVTIAPVLLHPKSTGKVYLHSNDPYDYPLIDPKYLSNEDDIATLINGINFVKKLLQTDAMKTVEATLYNKKFPGCQHKEFDTKEYWECYIQHLSLTSYHPAGTCRMGDVVNDRFRVYNITNLYVVDASVLPILPSGNINAAVIMLAERAIQMIRENNCMLQNSHKCYKSQHVCYVFKVCHSRCGNTFVT